MSNTRLRHPLHNLTQTAFDLTQYLKKIKQEEFINIVSPVFETYSAPTKSWVWYWFYTRARVQFLGDLIIQLSKKNDLNLSEKNIASEESKEEDKADNIIDDTDLNNLHHLVISTEASLLNADAVVTEAIQQAEEIKSKDLAEIVNKIMHEGGWEETSFNTNLMRALLGHLPDYDHEIQLTIKEIETLKELLFISLEEHQKADVKVTEEVDKLIIIHSESLQVENEFLVKEKALLQKQEEVLNNESIIIALEDNRVSDDINLAGIEDEKSRKIGELEKLTVELNQLESEKLKCESECKALEEEKHKCLEEINAARTKLLLLNPEFDIQKLSNVQIEKVMNEAKLYVEASLKDFFIQQEEIERRKIEREELARKRKELAEQARENMEKRKANQAEADRKPKPVILTNRPAFTKKSNVTAQLENTLFSNDQKQKQEAKEISEKRSKDAIDTCASRTKEENNDVKKILLKHLNNDKHDEARAKRAEEARAACSTREKSLNDKARQKLANLFNHNKDETDSRAVEAKEICSVRTKAMNDKAKQKLEKLFNKDKDEKAAKMEEVQKQCASIKTTKEDIKAALEMKFNYTADVNKPLEIKKCEISEQKIEQENEMKEKISTDTDTSRSSEKEKENENENEKENETQNVSAFRSGHPYFLQLLNQLNKNTKFQAQQHTISSDEQELAQAQVLQNEKKPEAENAIKQESGASLLQLNTMFKVSENISQKMSDTVKNDEALDPVSMTNR